MIIFLMSQHVQQLYRDLYRVTLSIFKTLYNYISIHFRLWIESQLVHSRQSKWLDDREKLA